MFHWDSLFASYSNWTIGVLHPLFWSSMWGYMYLMCVLNAIYRLITVQRPSSVMGSREVANLHWSETWQTIRLPSPRIQFRGPSMTRTVSSRAGRAHVYIFTELYFFIDLSFAAFFVFYLFVVKRLRFIDTRGFRVPLVPNSAVGVLNAEWLKEYFQV